MTPQAFYSTVLLNSVNILQMPATIDTLDSRVQMMATAGQESAWYFRLQVGGPARGFWQCETESVQSVLQSKTTGPWLTAVCSLLSVSTDVATVYEAIAWCDPLAYAIGRGILLMDPLPIPSNNPTSGYQCYIRNWRPGAPIPDTWDSFYETAVSLILPASSQGPQVI
jgi:hypothetical protein